MNHHLVFGKNFAQRKKLWDAYKLGKWESWDLGSKEGDIYCAMSVGYNKRGQLIIKGITYQEFYKGGEKMDFRERPYLEVEVVEVKTKKKKEIPAGCVNCGKKEFCARYERDYKKLEKEGNWVNGENLDKMKFPCYCTFDTNKGMLRDPGKYYKVCGIGKIDMNFTEEQVQYQLSWADHQQEGLSVLCETPSLKRLIELYDIHIEKAKIVIFKETK